MKRGRQDLSVAPICITQRNCQAALGIPERWYRDNATRLVPYRREGQLIITRASDWAALVATQHAANAEPPRLNVETADEILRSLGVRRTA